MDIQVTMIQIIVADPVEGPGYPLPHSYFSDQTEAQRAKKKVFWRLPSPTPLCQGLDRALNYTSSTMLSHDRVVQGGLN